jgi:hypothetical protein
MAAYCPHCKQPIQRIEAAIGSSNALQVIPAQCRCPQAQVELAARIAANNEQCVAIDRQHEVTSLLLRAGLDSPRYFSKRFASPFWDDGRNEGQAGIARAAVEAYADSVKLRSDNWAIFHGSYGVGKTHLAIAALRKIAATNLWPAMVINWPELNAETREKWGSRKDGSEAAVWGRARAVKALLIDDLDKVMTDQLSVEKLYSVLNGRFDNQYPTIITMNHTLDGLRNKWRNGPAHLADTGMAVLDRIEGQLCAEIHFEGESQRGI